MKIANLIFNEICMSLGLLNHCIVRIFHEMNAQLGLVFHTAMIWGMEILIDELDPLTLALTKKDH